MKKSNAPLRFWQLLRPRRTRGFLLMVVFGMIAVLLVLAVGFLTYTRAEVDSVATVRDKVDGTNIFYASLDWALSNAVNDLAPGGNFDSNAVVARVHGSGAGARWWYRPYEPGMSKWINSKVTNRGSCQITAADEAPRVYMPDDYFPEGGVKARVAVQVFDPNAVPCVNDFLEDGNPTQCQMAHMLMDGYGEQQVEAYRQYRDTGAFNAQSIEPWASKNNGARNFAPLRYHEMWRVATRTTRYMYWVFGEQWAAGSGRVSANWVTTNQTWLGLYGPEMCSLKPLIPSDGIPLAYIVDPKMIQSPGQYLPPLGFQAAGSSYGTGSGVPLIPQNGFDFDSTNQSVGLYYAFKSNAVVGGLPMNLPFSLMAYTDPDTGRCPINVNTCPNSGERLPTNVAFFNKAYANGTPAYSMEAVYNVESLRRIIKVKDFFYADKNNVKQQLTASDVYSADPAVNAPINWTNYQTVPGPDGTTPPNTPANIKAQMIETLENFRTKLAYQYQETLCRYFTATYRHPMQRKFPPLYNPVVDVPVDYSDDGTYQQAFPTGANVSYACKTYDYSQARFPVGLVAFRANTRGDLIAMGSGQPEEISFDNTDKPNVKAGFLDLRTAEAVYDNLIPGPATLGLLPYRPLQQLYDQGISRDELAPGNADIADPSNRGFNANVFGYWEDNLTRSDEGYRDLGNQPLHLRWKGEDVASTNAPSGPYIRRAPSQIPFRQMVFGPDWFSTELTVSTTTFMFIITVEIVDADSVAADPANPRVLLASQWGAVAEIAPDIKNELGNNGWYASDMPRRVKTEHNPNDFYSLDNRAGLAREYGSDANANMQIKRIVPEIQNEPLNAGAATDWNMKVPTAARDWIDWRGVPDDAAQRASFYGANSAKKQIRIRAIWSLNQGVK